MRPIKTIALLLLSSTIAQVNGQLTVDAELRQRFEYRHGFKTLFPDDTDPAAFVSQRTRLNVGHKTEKLNLYLSLQDVRVWGDVPQMNLSDKNGLGLHQAWGEILFNEHLSLRLGRQEISYDDHRIFGNVDWAQQARSHDAALIRYGRENFVLDLGLAFNQDTENVAGSTLRTADTYKSIQYAWAHKDWEQFKASLLFLNNGMQFLDGADPNNTETRYSHTLGTHLNTVGNKWRLSSNLYYQFGKDMANNSLSAYLLGLELNYVPSGTLGLALGTELQSGNTNGTPANGKNRAFTPFYGTNHKFNGYMDYFYVGNHANNVGLLDNYAKAKITLGHKSNLDLAVHYFLAASDMAENGPKQLGTELDLVYAYTYDKNIILNAGYSHMIAYKGMEILKGNMDGNTNYWGWIMVTIKPNLYKASKNKSDKTAEYDEYHIFLRPNGPIFTSK